MPPSNSSAIDSAVIGLLQNDSTLHSLLPDGVWMNLAPPGSQVFGIVSIWDAFDVWEFGQRAIEHITYAVEARALSTASANLNAAAQRIDELLENVTLTVAEYAWGDCARVGRIRLDEIDEVDPSILFHHRGGRYRVRASPLVPVLLHAG